MNELLRLKEALKITLAMGIALYIPIANDWSRPFWAALPVIFMAVEYSGSVMMRGVLRIIGTLIGVLILTIFFKLFIQNPFVYIVSLGLLLSICVFFAINSSIFVVFLVIGITPYIGLLDINSPQNLYDLTLYRIENTLAGALVYLVVSQIFFPNNGYKQIVHSIKNIIKKINYIFSLLATNQPATNMKQLLDSLNKAKEGYVAILNQVKTEYGVQFLYPKAFDKVSTELDKLIKETSLLAESTLLADANKQSATHHQDIKKIAFIVQHHLKEIICNVEYVLNNQKKWTLAKSRTENNANAVLDSDILKAMIELHRKLVLLHRALHKKSSFLQKVIPVFIYPITIDRSLSAQRFQRASAPLIATLVAYLFSYYTGSPFQSFIILLSAILASILNIAIAIPAYKLVMAFLGGFIVGGLYACMMLPLLSNYYAVFIPCAIVYIATYLIAFDMRYMLFRLLFLLTFSLSVFFFPYYSPQLTGGLAFKLNELIALVTTVIIAFIPTMLFSVFHRIKNSFLHD